MITVEFTPIELTDLYELLTGTLDNMPSLLNPERYKNLEAIRDRLFDLPNYMEDHEGSYFET